ncbi:sodium- and chloride-dependent taurine transporter-like [Elysia marginata]|uniref:Sodium- and chloride-dependent taurine transporter-like n=1 Tax=Elysia marginata TaxID=1093978 RepID=A0AAV4H0E1_9GAST|nr:sodium- and chloride-dependent taurine transporter-like [Elysia marginata]
MEVALGQFMSEGGIGPWRIAPLFQGIGYATAVIVFLLNCEYNIILSWAFYYFFASLTSVLPWSLCDNEWNTENCTTLEELRLMKQNATSTEEPPLGDKSSGSALGLVASTFAYHNDTLNVTALSELFEDGKGNTSKVIYPDPVTEFWERKVLGLSSGVGEPGNIKWDLALCLLLAWIVVYFCICKGIKSSGKVMYVTATSPYIFMFILLIRGVTLEGSSLGLEYYLNPKWERLADAQVWVDAGTQIFFSYSISLGTLTALGSYNKFHHNCFR